MEWKLVSQRNHKHFAFQLYLVSVIKWTSCWYGGSSSRWGGSVMTLQVIIASMVHPMWVSTKSNNWMTVLHGSVLSHGSVPSHGSNVACCHSYGMTLKFHSSIHSWHQEIFELVKQVCQLKELLLTMSNCMCCWMLMIPYLNKLTDGVHCNGVPHESNTQLYIAWWRRGIVAVVTQLQGQGLLPLLQL